MFNKGKEIYTLAWWEKTGHSWEWQEIEVMAYNEIHMINQIDKSIIQKIEKGRNEGTVLGIIYWTRKPTLLERLIYI